MFYIYILYIYAEQVAPTIGPSIFATAIGDNSWGGYNISMRARTLRAEGGEL